MHRAACDLAECACFNSSFVWAIPAVKLVYYEVPRCGSSSIKKILQSEFSEIGVNDEPPANFASFVVVRNPWERALSAWLLFTTFNQGGRGSQRMAQCTELFGHLPLFEEFIKRMFDKGSTNHHWAPCINYMPDDGRVNHLLTLANLEEDWSVLRVAYPTLPPLIHIRVGQQLDKHYSFYYNDKMRESIGEYFQDDVERFEFTFEDQR